VLLSFVTLRYPENLFPLLFVLSHPLAVFSLFLFYFLFPVSLFASSDSTTQIFFPFISLVLRHHDLTLIDTYCLSFTFSIFFAFSSRKRVVVGWGPGPTFLFCAGGIRLKLPDAANFNLLEKVRTACFLCQRLPSITLRRAVGCLALS